MNLIGKILVKTLDGFMCGKQAEIVDIEIKRVTTDDEKRVVDEMPIYGYYESPHASNEGVMERGRALSDTFGWREYIVTEDKEIVSCAGYVLLTQNIRGKIFNMGGVLNVNTYPEARRKGYVTKLMRHMFDEMLNENITFSSLYPFKNSYYGRYGYFNYPQNRTAVVKPETLKPVSKLSFSGTIKRGHYKELYEEYLEVLKKEQLVTHGMAVFENLDKMPPQYMPDMYAVVIFDGEDPVGFMSYRTEGIFKPASVRDFLWLTPDAKYQLLNYIYLHADQFIEFKIPMRPDEHPEYWSFDANPKITTREWVPSAQGRIVIMDQISGMEIGEGGISLKVDDEWCDWNDKVWKLSSEDGKLLVNAGSEPQCTVSIDALSALVHGCYNPFDWPKRWGLELTQEQLDMLYKMFPPVLPYLYSAF